MQQIKIKDMRKNKKNKPAPSKEKASFLGSAGRNMTYRDLKRKAIVLGMPFPDACAAGVFDLIGYIERSTNKPDKSLIDQYDDWMDKQLENIGYSKDDPLRNSKLRLGFLGESITLWFRTARRTMNNGKTKGK
mgnify:CR=1 FL=1